MKKITMFTMEACPYCQKALRWMDTLISENPDYKRLEIEMIDELVYPDTAAQFDYYYVPTYYVDGKKLHEGVADLKKIKRVFDAAIGG